MWCSVTFRKLCLAGAVGILLAACTTPPSLPASTVVERTVETKAAAPAAFDLTSAWIDKTFNSAGAILNKADRASGHFSGRSWSVIDNKGVAEREIDYSIDIQVSEGATRFRFGTLYVMETTYKPRENMLGWDDPMIVRVRRAVTQASFDSFLRLVDTMMSDYQKSLSAQTKVGGS